MRTQLLMAGAVALGLVVSGCNKKIPECNSVVDVIHAASASIKAANGPDKAKAIVAADEKAVADLGKLPLTIPEVKKFADDFKASYQADADQTKKMVALTSGEGADAEKMAALTKEIETSGDALTKLAESFDKFCQAP